MTITTLITINAILGAAVVYGLISLLAQGVRPGRPAVVAQVRQPRRRELDRLAA